MTMTAFHWTKVLGYLWCMQQTMTVAASTSAEPTAAAATSTSTSHRLLDDLPPLAENSRRVYLLRHGETDWNTRGLIQGGGFDVELNAAGRIQAQKLGQALKGLPIGVLASSHLNRSRQTAEIILAQQESSNSDSNAIIRMTDERLGEMRFGEFEGVAIRGPESTAETRARVERLNTMMHQDTSMPWPGVGGESVATVQARSMAGVQQILKDSPDTCNHICIVAHGRWNKILLEQILPDNKEENNVARNGLTTQRNGCINVLDIDEQGNWKPCLLNYVAHLEE